MFPFKRFGPSLSMYELQTPVTLDQPNPVMGTMYELLPLTKNVRVYGIAINIEDVDELVAVRITIEGGVRSSGAFAGQQHSTTYYVRRYSTALYMVSKFQSSNENVPMAFLCEGKEVGISISKSTANGAGNMTAICEYGVLKDAN